MSSAKVALVTGITGQDGVYLAELLLSKGYTVHGVRRRSSSSRIDHLCSDPRLILHYGDLTDSESLMRIIDETQPDELYNLGAQSNIAASFEQPLSTADADGLGTLRILEAIRRLGMRDKTRFYQASAAALFGNASEWPQRESTPFHPRSPYAVAKLYAYWITVNYREAFGFYACNGILFSHESPIRAEEFVTRKITRALARIKLGIQAELLIGNLDAKRDWGHASDYVEAMWLMLQQPEPDDYVIATGEQHTVREFIETAAHELGMTLRWSGTGAGERGFDEKGRCIVQVDPAYYRPAEVHSLLGDAGKARATLGWRPKVAFRELVAEMARADLDLAERDIPRKVIGL